MRSASIGVEYEDGFLSHALVFNCGVAKHIGSVLCVHPPHIVSVMDHHAPPCVCTCGLATQPHPPRRTAVASEEEATAITTLQRMVTAKDRELVALHAEKEALLQVQSGTWQLLDEREAEVHRLQVGRNGVRGAAVLHIGCGWRDVHLLRPAVDTAAAPGGECTAAGGA